MSLSWRVRRLASSALTDLILWSLWTLVTLAAIILPIYLGASFLMVRDCHPNVNISVNPSDFIGNVDISELISGPSSAASSDLVDDSDNDLTISDDYYEDEDGYDDYEEEITTMASMSPTEKPDEEPFLSKFLSTDLDLTVGRDNISVSAPMLPKHLLMSVVTMVTNELSKYSINDVADYCNINDISQQPGLLSLGVSVCSEAMNEVLGQEASDQVNSWVTAISGDTQKGLVDSVINVNLTEAIKYIPKLFPEAGITSDHEAALTTLAGPMTATDLNILINVVRNENFTTFVADAEKVFMKIDTDNLPAIVEKLGQLEIDLADFITNPGIFFEFLDDPVKLGILTELQTLLPQFKPADIEAFLQIQELMDQAQRQFGNPNEPTIISKLLAVPLDHLLTALPKINEVKDLLEQDESFQSLSSLMDMEKISNLVSSCSSQEFRVSCQDSSHDVCPAGHLFLGLASLAPLILPGLLYSLTTFLHYQGDVMQCGLGKPFNIPSSKLDRISAWIILLPMYMLFMIPWTLLLIVYRQIVVCTSLLREISGGNKVEADCDAINNASSFGLLFGAGQGVLHLGLQMIVVILLLSVGDLIFGLNQVFIRDHVAVCIISAILGVIILTVSYISSQEAGRLTRDLPTPHNSFTYFNTSLVWLLTSVIISIISTLILCVILYVDSLHFTRATWLIVPIVILGLLPIIQCLIYCRLVKEGSEHRYAWGVFAAVTAARFLQSDRRPAAMYLFVSQLVWFLCHSSAWVAYCVYSIVQDQSDVVFRVWLPIIMPLLLISPLVASLHWSLSLSPVYFSPHAHPDMADTQKRTFSFPPDWKTISGSSVAPDNLAKAGFFYSCRRLTTCEATCYGCGRQVADWSNMKNADMAHKMTCDSCPLHSDTKKSVEPEQNFENSNVSCFAEFLFISTTLLFRIASFCLLLWVFMEQWTTVSNQLITLIIIPPLYLLVLILYNTSTYFICLGNTYSSSWIWALVSVLLPRPVKCDLSSARQLLVINVASNTLIHAFLWAAMTGSCSTCSLSVSLSSLTVAWPALVVLSSLAIFATFPYYYLTVKNQTKNVPSKRSHTNAAFMVSTAL